jgi:mgtC/sapB transporter
MFEFFSNISKIKFVGELTVDVVFLRLLLAVIFGGIVGIERERNNKPAGFRTYILVCFGAAIVSIVQDQLRINIFNFEKNFPDLASFMKSDLGRLGAQVISGIGFLGAGSIIKEKGEVEGLTTAAGIWATGCVGLGIGWGFYNIAIVAIIFMLIIMTALKKVETIFMKKSSNLIFEIEIDENSAVSEIISECYEVFIQKEININKVDKNLKNNIITFNATTEENNKNLSEIVMILSSKNNIKSVKDMSF